MNHLSRALAAAMGAPDAVRPALGELVSGTDRGGPLAIDQARLLFEQALGASRMNPPPDEIPLRTLGPDVVDACRSATAILMSPQVKRLGARSPQRPASVATTPTDQSADPIGQGARQAAREPLTTASSQGAGEAPSSEAESAKRPLSQPGAHAECVSMPPSPDSGFVRPDSALPQSQPPPIRNRRSAIVAALTSLAQDMSPAIAAAHSPDRVLTIEHEAREHATCDVAAPMQSAWLAPPAAAIAARGSETPGTEARAAEIVRPSELPSAPRHVDRGFDRVNRHPIATVRWHPSSGVHKQERELADSSSTVRVSMPSSSASVSLPPDSAVPQPQPQPLPFRSRRSAIFAAQTLPVQGLSPAIPMTHPSSRTVTAEYAASHDRASDVAPGDADPLERVGPRAVPHPAGRIPDGPPIQKASESSYHQAPRSEPLSVQAQTDSGQAGSTELQAAALASPAVLAPDGAHEASDVAARVAPELDGSARNSVVDAVVARMMVGETPAGGQQVRIEIGDDYLRGVTVVVQQAAAQLHVAFECSSQASWQRIDRVAPMLAKSLARRLGRDVVVQVRGGATDDAAVQQVCETDAGAGS